MSRALRRRYGSVVLSRAQRDYIVKHERMFTPEALVFARDRRTFDALLRAGLLETQQRGRTRGFVVTRAGREAAHPLGM